MDRKQTTHKRRGRRSISSDSAVSRNQLPTKEIASQQSFVPTPQPNAFGPATFNASTMESHHTPFACTTGVNVPGATKVSGVQHRRNGSSAGFSHQTAKAFQQGNNNNNNNPNNPYFSGSTTSSSVSFSDVSSPYTYSTVGDDHAEEFSSSCGGPFDDGSNTQFVLIGLCKILSDVCADNDQKPLATHANDRFIKFCSSVIPPISVSEYVKRIARYGELDCACYVMALMHIDRLINRHSLILTTSTIHRLFLTCCVVSAKFHQDSFYTNAVYAKVGGICNKEMNELELDLLFLLNFDISFSRDEYDVYFRQLLLHGRGTSSHAVSSAVSIPQPSPVHVPSASRVVADTALRPSKQFPPSSVPRSQRDYASSNSHNFNNNHNNINTSNRGHFSSQYQPQYPQPQPQPQHQHQHHQHQHQHQQPLAHNKQQLQFASQPRPVKQPENVQSISNGVVCYPVAPAGSPGLTNFSSKPVGFNGYADAVTYETDGDCGMQSMLTPDRQRRKSVEMQTFPLAGMGGALMMVGMHPKSAFSNAPGAMDAPVTVLPLHHNGVMRPDLLSSYAMPDPYQMCGVFPPNGYHFTPPTSNSPPVH